MSQDSTAELWTLAHIPVVHLAVHRLAIRKTSPARKGVLPTA
ncbi:hypothetical protein [Pelotomaculum schinkii]|nr:hypothetical protein [Pelotomaculum schinkii]